jgi:antitoxin ParD1/3/4
MATMNISLPDAMKAMVETQVATGLYANASDYVRDAIRDRLRNQKYLFDALEEGLSSGPSHRSLDEIIEQEFARFPSVS